ncbi:hypothetical protein [Liquorilactobacillus mali]|uniref:Uncharacterized protein n=1 Tax=Liquorilactobacillus mali KCTC 3596 = DSM 20444 TaxID=1046596 RepID=J1F0S6_9LACO|nr:hypothetical protein [Liquorilactobacillus mali]EJE97755.1 hypothetical protein LMA_09198 [Liquorilactobacillus mali KCTC 3596 = DSM 20444]KRN10834.1 hypothetical protein FD00_GL002077 [Liquorilactobacillus mali KCTC 3596 = DSM 20444]
MWLSNLKEGIDLTSQILSAPIVVTSLAFCWKWFKHKREMDKEKLENLQNTDRLLTEAVKALLHNKIYDNCTHYIERGYITTGEKDDLDYLYGGYSGIGGNSTGEWLYLNASKLPIREK